MRITFWRPRAGVPGRAALGAAVLFGAIWLGIACSAATGAKAGTQCFSTIDCAAGLACVPTGSIRKCSSNLSGLEVMEDAGLEAQAPTDSSVPPGIYPTDSGGAVEDAPAHQSGG